MPIECLWPNDVRSGSAEPVGLDAALDVLQLAVVLFELRGDLRRIVRVVVAGQPFGFEFLAAFIRL